LRPVKAEQEDDREFSEFLFVFSGRIAVSQSLVAFMRAFFKGTVLYKSLQELAGFLFVKDLHELCEEAFVLFVRTKGFAGTNRVSSSFVYE
jgi:hypothetical protein